MSDTSRDPDCKHTLTAWKIGLLGPMTNTGARVRQWEKTCSWCGEVLETATQRPKEDA